MLHNKETHTAATGTSIGLSHYQWLSSEEPLIPYSHFSNPAL